MVKKVYSFAPVTFTFFLASFVVLALSWLTSGLTNNLLFSVYRTSFTDPLAYVRVFTHILGHADWQHFAANFGIAILVLGACMERRYGSKNLFYFIALTALITGGFHLLTKPAGHVLVGASGVVCMLIMLTAWTLLRKMRWGGLPIILLIVVTLYIGREVFSLVLQGTGILLSNVSYVSHIIGGLCGIVFGATYRRFERKPKEATEQNSP